MIPGLPLLPNIPDLSQLDAAFKQSPMAKEVVEYRLHVEWRKLLNEVANDPDVVAAKVAADRARTDLNKRNLMRKYYEIYYGRMRARAGTPELKAYVDAMRVAHQNSLAQPSVRPTPTPMPKPSAKKAG